MRVVKHKTARKEPAKIVMKPENYKLLRSMSRG